MSNLVKVDPRLPSILQNYIQQQQLQDELGAGISGGFGVISIKGRSWSVKAHGEQELLMNPKDPSSPASYIEAVIVKSSTVITKVFYKAAFTEGDDAAPDCWSTNGVTPDPEVQEKQNKICATCRWNQFNSRPSADGKGGKGKACGDSKRLAVLLTDDILNGEPLLLRVPAASLQDVKAYAQELGKRQFPYFAAATRIGFDTSVAFPKLTFAPVRALTEEEVSRVIELREDERVERILAAAPVIIDENAAEAPAEDKAPDPFAGLGAPPAAVMAGATPTAGTAPTVVTSQGKATNPAKKAAAKPAAKAEVPHDPLTGEVLQQTITTEPPADDEEAKLLAALAESRAKKQAAAAQAAAAPTPANDPVPAGEDEAAPTGIANLDNLLDGLLK